MIWYIFSVIFNFFVASIIIEIGFHNDTSWDARYRKDEAYFTSAVISLLGPIALVIVAVVGVFYLMTRLTKKIAARIIKLVDKPDDEE